MRQIEPDFTARNRLMMGPDGTVHVVPASAGRNSPPPVEKDGRSAAEQQESTSSQTDLPSEPEAGLHGIRQAPGTGAVCFSYSAPMPSPEGDILRAPGDGGICFSYATRRPLTDRDVARRALQDIRRMPEGGVCFSY